MISRFCFVAVVLFVPLADLRAEEVEVRTFSISVDGKASGEYRVSVQVLDDGSRQATVESVTKVPQGTGWRRTSYAGVEVWKGGKLQRLDARCYDDGKRRHLTAAPNAGQLRVMINGQRTDVRADVWTNTYWFVPEMTERTQAMAIFEVESGKVIAAQLEQLGAEKLTVIGQGLDCSRFRLRGDNLKADLWYDGADRLIKLDATEDKHRTVLELIKVQR